MKIENLNITGFATAIRALHNELGSWHNSDSKFELINNNDTIDSTIMINYIGENDKKLLLEKNNNGAVAAKYRRFIHVSMDLTAPIYFWNDIDSLFFYTDIYFKDTLYAIKDIEIFSLDNFSIEHLDSTGISNLNYIIDQLNYYLAQLKVTKNKSWWYMIISLLPQNYNKKATVHFNYDGANRIYQATNNNLLLTEWDWIKKTLESLPESWMFTED